MLFERWKIWNVETCPPDERKKVTELTTIRNFNTTHIHRHTLKRAQTMPLHQKLKPPDERNSVLPLPLMMMMMMIEKLYKFIDFVTKTTVYVRQKRKKKSKYTTDYWAICKFRIDLAHFFLNQIIFAVGYMPISTIRST